MSSEGTTNECRDLRQSYYNGKGQDPEMQLTELREFANKRGWQIAGEFVDVGVSGSKDLRPQLDAMMRLAKARKVDVIVCWKLDRFGRSLRHLVDALAECKRSAALSYRCVTTWT